MGGDKRRGTALLNDIRCLLPLADYPGFPRIDSVSVYGQLADPVGGDRAAFRVEYAVDRAVDLRVYVGVFKGERRVDKAAAAHFQLVYVAQPLKAFDRAVYERHVPCVPSEIFAGQERVVNGDVLAVPEGVAPDDL